MINCPICKSDKTQHYYKNEVLILLRCKRCRVKFQHPMPKPKFLNQLYSSEYYNTYYPDRVLKEQKLLFDSHLKMIEEMNGGRVGKLLDIGTGRGMFLDTARDRGWNCIGYEFSRYAADSIRNSLGIDVVVNSDFLETRFAPESFDLVNMNHVLEHLYKPVETIKEVYRILKPGGLFYCEVPRQNNFLNRMSNLLGKKDFGFTYKLVHLFIFDKSTIPFLFREADFEFLYLKIEGIGSPHRYINGVHYTSTWAFFIAKIVEKFRLEIPLKGGNLVIISRKCGGR